MQFLPKEDSAIFLRKKKKKNWRPSVCEDRCVDSGSLDVGGWQLALQTRLPGKGAGPGGQGQEQATTKPNFSKAAGH